MRYVIFAILIYIAYLIIKSVIRVMNAKEQGSSTQKDKQKRSYDLNSAEDAEFREVNKE